MRKVTLALGAGLTALTMLLTACGGTASAPAPTSKADAETKELVVYTGRSETLVKPVLEAFEKATGVKVTYKAAGATELANLILEEKSSPKADIYLANDAGALEKLRIEKALEVYTSENLKKVPGDLKAVDNSWYAVTARARVIMYNKALVSEAELPKSLKDLADPKWKDQIGMATGANESVIANVTALRLTEGEQAAEKFLNDLKNNGLKVYKGHGDVRKAVGAGQIKLGWVNHYYYHLQTHEAEGNNVGVIYPDQDGAGATVNIAGAAIVKGAKNMANAKKFLDWLLTPETQKLFAELNYEMPVLPGVATKEAKALGEFKRNAVKLGQFGEQWDKSVQLIDKIGLVLK
ncbi:MAG: extracellular solute-binding protein [Symbiobacteriaceae bacterium]|jgi:iron(III) transport system substrate-binding protein|nr:extracellular solute-binding protein [Symbiobacteriaceae bacterium]